MKISVLYRAFAILAGLMFAVQLHALPEDFLDKLAAPERPVEDKARDEARRPQLVLEFLGIDAGMTVLDVAAGAGWYTEVLSAAVGPEGSVVMQAGQRMLPQQEALLDRAERLGNVSVAFEETWDLNMDGQLDAAITALSLHDNLNLRGEEGVANFLQGIYMALKPGAVLGVIDHIGEQGNDNAALHRITIEDAREQLRKNGFVIEEESDFLRNPADDHTLSVGDPALGRNTDRFLFRARKPE